MQLSKKISNYLRNSHIDFGSFYILDIIPQNENDAVVLLAPKHGNEIRHFHLQTKCTSNYFSTVENLMIACVEYGYCKRSYADKLLEHHYDTLQDFYF